MAIILNDNLKYNAPKPADERYLKPDNSPYLSTAEVNTLIHPSRRFIGLTVRVGNDEYWYHLGILDIDLVLKTGGSSITKNSVIFTNETLINVVHGKNEGVLISIVSDTNEDITNAGSIQQIPYPNPTSFTVEFNSPLSGTIYYI